MSEYSEQSSEQSNDNQIILSWDVGIKNLAYCMLSKDGENFQILKWDSINLVEDQQKCEFELRSGSTCQEVAKFYVYHRDKICLFDKCEGKFCCTRHKVKMTPQIEKIKGENIKNKKTKNKEENILYCHLCDSEANYKLCDTNYCWCENHYEKKGKSFVKKVHAKKVTIANCNKQQIQELAEKLFARLDKNLNDFIKVDEVLIENQPTLKNPKMKNLASMLYSYFVLRGIIDKKNNKSNINQVKFICPQNKLKVNNENTNKILDVDKSKVYKLTKKLGVKYCRALISEKDDKIIEKMKKKDDMCDAFLQGFRYLFNPLPQIYFKKLEKIGFETD